APAWRGREFFARSRRAPVTHSAMRQWSRWVGVGAAAGIISALVPVVRGNISLEGPLSRLERQRGAEEPPVPPLDGLDLRRLDLRPRRVLAPLTQGRVA